MLVELIVLYPSSAAKEHGNCISLTVSNDFLLLTWVRLFVEAQLWLIFRSIHSIFMTNYRDNSNKNGVNWAKINRIQRKTFWRTIFILKLTHCRITIISSISEQILNLQKFLSTRIIIELRLIGRSTVILSPMLLLSKGWLV